MQSRLDRMPEWQSLKRHAGAVKNRRIDALFDRDRNRFQNFSISAAGLFLDYSKQNIDARTRSLLLDLARATDVEGWRGRLFRGEHVNGTEKRAALHTALRAEGPSADLTPPAALEAARDFQQRMETFVTAIRSGEWRAHGGERIDTVINIGIGGSDLGPAMVARALSPDIADGPEVRFVSNVDPAHLRAALTDADPDTTLFIIASKTFTTQETLSNARGARDWLQAARPGTDIGRHFAAVSSRPDRAREFGIPEENVFPMADWVGGRYSLWSTIGLPIALAIGMPGFRELLRGASAMDEHFLVAPLEENLPVLLALTGIWNRNFRHAASLVIAPYAQRLDLLPPYLQQLEMESNGKGVTREGEAVTWDTCPAIWGVAGTNGQHAFFQQLHQGGEELPVDFVVVARDAGGDAARQRLLVSNAIAQSAALMRGRNVDEVRERMQVDGAPAEEIERLAPHRTFPGNRPSNTIVLDELTPATLGALLALYEHKVFVQGVIWQICPFDQWGVELGKELAANVGRLLAGEVDARGVDGSTRGLVERLTRGGEARD